MSMQAVLTAPRIIALNEAPSRNLAPWEARIAVAFAGVCGTDLAIYKGQYRVPLPLVMGHEFSGIVTEVGSQRHATLLGKRCTAEINNSCIAREEADPCEACRRALPSHCQTRTVVGIDRYDGAFATEVIVPAANVHPLPDNISDRAAIFIEPLAAALQTFEMAPLKQDSGPRDGPPWVIVLGAGRLGLLTAIIAKSLGARVIGISRTTRSLQRAAPFCDHVLAADRPDLVVTYVREQTGGLGADYVVEATASPLGLHFAAQLVRPRGVIALKSTPGLPVDGLNLTALVVNEIRLQGSRCGPFDKAISFLSSSTVDFESLITSQFSLSDAAAALEEADNATKVVIKCNA